MSHRWSFARKVAAAAALVGLADWLFYGEEPGWTLGAFAIAWIVALLLIAPALRQPLPAAVLALAAALGLVLIDDPNPLAWSLFWTAIASAALFPRRRFDDALRWGARLIAYGLIGLLAPLRDLLRSRRQRASKGVDRGSIVGLLALPLTGGGLFLALFAAANPLIERALAAIEVPDLWDTAGHLALASFVLVVVWPSFRPRAPALPNAYADVRHPEAPAATLLVSLVTFNAVFALQNGLDIAFLWSGAPLPDGMTMTEYVHRGAYPLIATALLAGLFVIVALRPGSVGGANPAIRRLVTVWVLQNIVLVGSSVLRTVRYIDESMLTEWRIAALSWMALVALGLALILWRLLTGRSAAWLINTNAAAAAVVLLAASVIDLGAIAAAWNVRHAPYTERLDLCYLRSLGSSALLPMIDLEGSAPTLALRDRATYHRAGIHADLRRQQADWHSWTWRGSRRLAAAETRLGPHPRAPSPAPHGRDCQGAIASPPPGQSPAPPLTGAPRP